MREEGETLSQDRIIHKDDPNYHRFDVSPLLKWFANQIVERDEEGNIIEKDDQEGPERIRQIH